MSAHDLTDAPGSAFQGSLPVDLHGFIKQRPSACLACGIFHNACGSGRQSLQTGTSLGRAFQTPVKPMSLETDEGFRLPVDYGEGTAGTFDFNYRQQGCRMQAEPFGFAFCGFNQGYFHRFHPCPFDGPIVAHVRGGWTKSGQKRYCRAMTKPNQNLPFKVAALYRFVRFPGFKAFREPLLDKCRSLMIKGTLLLAHEGINGTVAGKPSDIDSLIAFLMTVPEFQGMELKFSQALTMPFNRMKVRLKKEIVTMGVPDTDPLQVVGTYVAPQDWNALIADPDTIVIDTRNDYEYRMGTFERAIDPDIKSFVEFPDWVRAHRADMEGKKVAMFCTGGIRCEKSTAFAKDIGIENVYHLKGGILAYLELVPQEKSLWKGECFVFDERVTVGHGLALGDAVLCRACRAPLTPEERESPQYVEGVSCPHCHDTRSEDDKARYAERHKQVLLAGKRGKVHIGEG